MQIRNPLRNSTATPSNAPSAAAAAPPVTVQQLQQALQVANQKIADLDARLRQLETAIYVAPGGDVEISATGNLRMVAGQSLSISDALGNSLVMQANGIAIAGPMKVSVSTSTIDWTAGMLQGNAAMASFSGTVKCDTIIANSVVGSSYTPGAGNVW